MIRRSRGHLAILPARRGMRAPWLRCRTPGEIAALGRDDESAAQATPGAGESASAATPGAGESASAATPGAGESASAATPGAGDAGDVPGGDDGRADPVPTLARATFGHPTF
jgi:hypothetical protein